MRGPAGRPDAGLSLIEVMVVIAIVSILSAGSLFLLARPTSTASDWQALRRAYEAQRLAAVTSGTPMALQLSAGGMTRAIWQGAAAKENWLALSEPRAWARVPQALETQGLQVVFLPSGRASGLTLRFQGSDGSLTTCKAAQWEALSCT